MSAGDVVARNAKTVVSAIGGVITVLTVAAMLFQYAPTSVAGYGAAVLAAIEILRSVNVWIVRNEPVLAAAADAGSDLVTAIEHPGSAGAGAA
ncbi:hypothetical protein VMT65_22385 [Nocardia sp. CDC153]|uniref:hypothetical protein n=1 Tax=Nocardia sp. CDC153 TaxID=3112167 RepID=UPI002DBEB3BF|nr:hypothetical protein [Nocardia sp. CDC153]MEC3955798.1 hypothetical protein [Nocardia sp. CDC153]